MTAVKHPTLDDVTYVVPSESLRDWLDQGWTEVGAPAPEESDGGSGEQDDSGE